MNLTFTTVIIRLILKHYHYSQLFITRCTKPISARYCMPDAMPRNIPTSCRTVNFPSLFCTFTLQTNFTNTRMQKQTTYNYRHVKNHTHQCSVNVKSNALPNLAGCNHQCVWDMTIFTLTLK